MFRVNETKCMFSSKEILRILDCKACEVKDFEITEVSVDSRSVNKPESTLFFALKGINHDGHDYVEKLYEQRIFFLCPGLIFLSSMRFYRHFSNWQPGIAVK